MSYRLGIDVGGTFTDFLLIGEDVRLVHKTSSTPDDPSRGVADGLAGLAAQLDLTLEAFVAQLDLIVHGTTVTTNAVLTRDGARTGLLATEGFRDTLALRDGTREEPYDNRLAPPTPLVPRYLRLPVGGRIDYKGDELAPLATDDVRAAVETFAAEGVEAVAISFMHSPTEPAHERRARDLVAELMPDAYVTASSDLLPQVRYYDRTSTTVLNAYVGPIISRYLSALTRRLEMLAFGGTLLIMQSNGGVATPAEISERAALSLLSGPAAGPTAGLWQLAPHGLKDCITVDMGGTSFDAALVSGGEPLVMVDGVLDRWRLALPTIDIHTIGAGGGSIAWLDDGGLLHVGPQSAGAQPGPACYGRGGTQPTVTDADLVLGYLGEESFGHGGMRLDRDAAVRALEPLAAALGLSVEETAAGIYDVVNVTMATGVRDVSVRRGLDPRDFPLVVAGGAGPLHAAAIARELDVGALLVPRESSIFCAAGMLMSDFKHDYVRAYKTALADADAARVRALFDEMSSAGRDTLAREGVSGDAVELRAALDVRYIGQWHELTVTVDLPLEADAAAAAFHSEHDRLFGHASPGAPIEVLALRVSAVGRTEKPALGGRPDDAEAGAQHGERPVWDADERALVPTPVWDGQTLPVSTTLTGPAIVELSSTTIVVPRGFALEVDAYGAFAVHTRDRAAQLARSPKRYGVLGVGALGAAIAERLANQGLEVVAYDLDAERVAALAAAGVGAATSARDLAQRSDIVLVLLPDTPDIEAAFDGEAGLEAGLRDGATLLLGSTVNPATPQELARRLVARGIDVLDTPVSGGPFAARAGALAIMVGGSDAAYARCLPVLERLGRPVHIGPIGHGQIAKLANNLMGSVIAVGIAEGLALAAKAGADLDKVLEAIAGGSGASWILSHWMPRTVLAGRIDADFAVRLMVKDMGVLEEYARELGVPLRAGELARETFTELRDAGHGSHDFSVLVALHAAEAGVPFPIDLDQP